MTPEDAETFRKELIGFQLRQDINRVEFTLSLYHVTMYRIRGQVGLIRVDFHEREFIRTKPYQPRVLGPRDEGGHEIIVEA